jgi:alkylation response protein AidB-like acyl-CoA dehydrogenase
MTGGANFNEVFFDDVRIPDSMRVGDVNEGWRCAITTLMNERVAIGAGGGGGRGGGIDTLVKAAKKAGVDQDPVIRQRLMTVWIKATVLGYVGKRISQAVMSGRVPGPEGSIAKLSGALLARETSELAMSIAGASATAWDPAERRGNRWAQMLLQAPASGIAGGTNEVMRNIIGERVLGLPKEPQVDRDVPFRELKVGTQTSAV